MKKTAILSGIAIAILLGWGFRKVMESTAESTAMDEKLRELQNKFKRLDAA